MSMSTGSDTRMYAPRSESNLGYSKDDDDFKHGYGDPEQMEALRDQKQAEKEKPVMTEELPHIRMDISQPKSPAPPPMMEEEPPMMDDQFNEGQQFGAMTGMPDMGNLSIGNATGTMPAPGGMLATGEPMEHAWSSLLKQDPYHEHDVRRSEPIGTAWRLLKGGVKDILTSVMETGPSATYQELLYSGMDPEDAKRFVNQSINIINNNPQDYSYAPEVIKSKLDEMGTAKDKTWRQPEFETQPGGSRIDTATSRRAKTQARSVKPGKKRGLDKSPLSVHRTHLGDKTKQPLRLFPQQYGQQQATQARRKLMGNVPQIPAGHGIGAETDYNPKVPKVGGTGAIKEPLSLPEKGKGFAKSAELIRSDIAEIRKKMDYMQFTQMRKLMRDLKSALEQREKSKKAAVSSGPGEKGQAGHREGQDSTTKPEGATENLEDDPKNWGAPSTLFAAPGSGRVG